MKEKDIISIWEKGDHGVNETGRLHGSDIEKYIQGKVRSRLNSPAGLIITYQVIQLAALVLAIMNLHIYRSNLVLILVNMLIILTMAGFIMYGLHLLKKNREQNRNHSDIMTLIRKKINFNQKAMEWWYVMCGLTLVALTFVFTSSMEPENGHYPINKPHIFIIVSVISFAIVYFISRFSINFQNKQLNLYLKGLESKMLDKEFRLEEKRKRQIWIGIFVFLAGLALLGYFIYRNG